MKLRKIINLSPLVDVLMIVIFWYIMMSNQTIEENKAMAESELDAMQSYYTAELESVTAQKEQTETQLNDLKLEHEQLTEEAELYREINDDLSDRLGDLREENEKLSIMLEQAVGYVYLHLYNGLNENRIVEVRYESELVDKFIFSGGESEYLTQKLTKVVTEYATRDEKERIAVIFIYEGNNAFYVDITQIMSVLYKLRTELGTSVHTINMAEWRKE